MARLNSRWRAATGLGLTLALGSLAQLGLASANPVEEYQSKAAILYNLTKFVEWPPEALSKPTDPIEICVLGESPIQDLLQNAVAGRQMEGRKFEVRQVSAALEAASCQVLFISSARLRWRSVLAELKNRGILTVGEADTFTSEGGIVNLKTDSGKVRIQINVEAASREKLKISSRLLSLAQIVGK